MRDRLTNSASVTIRNKLFLIGVSLFLFFSDGTAGTVPRCGPGVSVKVSQVAYVHDGDTIHLADGDKVRIIGINTPEIAHRGSPGEPLGEHARDLLRGKIGGKAIHLEFDVQHKDHYGRKLAHIYLLNGTNISAWLIEQGAAYAVSISPNLRYRECYRAAEQIARDEKRGIWGHSYYMPVAAENVQRTGFMRIQGCVKKVTEDRKKIDLALADDMLLRIRMDRVGSYFEPWLDNLGNRLSRICVLARGWVYNDKRNERYILEVKHPDAVEIFSSP